MPERPQNQYHTAISVVPPGDTRAVTLPREAAPVPAVRPLAAGDYWFHVDTAAGPRGGRRTG
ncbi:hypothetical protein ABZZ17_22925 [Streptomyces sp. NPDC006512]|uniref:hypothetical protein n=1 Tax=Streptomyces sp. NPDC006512 TaxID=3154307 RepID=UPI00339E1820